MFSSLWLILNLKLITLRGLKKISGLVFSKLAKTESIIVLKLAVFAIAREELLLKGSMPCGGSNKEASGPGSRLHQ